MQTIQREQQNIHPLFTELDKLYAELSEWEPGSKLVYNTYSNIFDPLISLFRYYGFAGKIQTRKKRFPKIKIPRKNKNIIVCFSGGKDSIAVVQDYINTGYNVYLYHMKHINPPLYDEYIQAQKLADYWGLPLYVDTVKLSGKHDFVEHPMKNMIIASGALQWGIREGITTNIAFGNYNTSSLQDDNFEFCGGDDMEMWDIYNGIIQHIIPHFTVQVILSNLGETLEVVCPNREVLDMSVSCLGRASMRKYWHDWVKSKFNILLPVHRCGRCYKCCIEYIYMTDHNLQEYSKDYYRYCLSNLKKNVERETGMQYTDEEVWEHYFFYEREQSKFYGS